MSVSLHFAILSGSLHVPGKVYIGGASRKNHLKFSIRIRATITPEPRPDISRRMPINPNMFI